MRTVLKSDFLWQFLGGFVLGAIGLAGLHLVEPETPPVEVSASAGHATVSDSGQVHLNMLM